MLQIAPDLYIPDDAVTQTFAILAKRGSGKTYTAAVLAEELIGAGDRVVVLDPVGVWWGLRANAAGTGPGLPVVILGGEHGDLPLHADAGVAIAHLIVKTHGSFVLDVSRMNKSERRRFVAAFADTLFRENRAPIHVMLDEADTFAPQRTMHGDEHMLGAIDTMVRQGRARGIGVTLITQRPAVVSKNVLSQTEALIVLRTTGTGDKKAIRDWLAQGDDRTQANEVLTSLPGLAIGEAWIVSQGWLNACERIKIRKRRTFDSSATPTGSGAHRGAEPPLAPVDIGAIVQALEESRPPRPPAPPEKRRAPASDIGLQATSGSRAPGPASGAEMEVVKLRAENAELRDRVAELETALASLFESGEQAAAAMKAADVHLTAMRGLFAWAKTSSQKPTASPITAEKPSTAVLEAAAREVSAPFEALVASAPTAPPRPRAPAAPPKPAPVDMNAESSPFGAPPLRPPKANPEDPLKEGERWIITALVRMGRALTLEELATVSGFASRGGTFGDYRSTLTRYGLMEKRGDGRFDATLAGVKYVRETQKIVGGPLSMKEIVSQWQLKRGERNMLSVVLQHRDGIPREQLGGAVGMTSTGGTFGDYLSTLRRAGLITSDSQTRRIFPHPTLYLGEIT